jgi:hypothetical protein
MTKTMDSRYVTDAAESKNAQIYIIKRAKKMCTTKLQREDMVLGVRKYRLAPKLKKNLHKNTI